ncbi:MAG: hypothetical protein HYT80_04935 [Euryarchaeota archaeon]|nr:hypothetical protein [Euryarchaeota archaeon]
MTTKLVRATSIGLTAAFLISFLAVFVPSAVAQAAPEVKFEVTFVKVDNIGEDNRLDPESELAQIQWKVQVKPPGTPTGCVSAYTLSYEPVGKLGYQSITISPPTNSGNIGKYGVANTGQADDTPQPYTVTMTISASREAPAFKDDEYALKVTLVVPGNTNGCGVTAQGPVTAKTSVKNDYMPLTTVEPGVYFQKAGQNKKVVFPVKVQNIGNGPSRVRLEIIPLGKNRLDSIIPPAELRLESRAQKGSAALFKADTRVEAQTPHSNGYTNSIYSFQVKFITSYDGTGENTANDETSVTLSVQVQGVYVPGFDSVAMLGALSIALMGVGFLRRKK